MSLSSRIVYQIDGTLTSAQDLATGTAPLTRKEVLTYAGGAGANQADKIWHDQRTIAASTTEDLDVSGSLTDIFGAAFELVKLRALLVVAAAANTNNVVLFGDANSVPILGTLATTLALPPGAVFSVAYPALAGLAVTAGTGDIIQVANGGAGTSVVYDIVIVGCSA